MQRKYPNFGESIDFYQDLQPILRAYLLTHPDAGAASTVAVDTFELGDSAHNKKGFPSELTRVHDRIKDIKKTTDSPIIRRLVIPLPLNGDLGHFGYAVIDLQTNELVIGEPLGSGGYQDAINFYSAAIQNEFPGIKLIPFNQRLQTDNFSCGRITSKLLAYLGTTSQSLQKAVTNQTEISKCCALDEASQQKLYDEQKELFENNSIPKSDAELENLYQPLMNEMSITLEVSDNFIYKGLHDAFTTGGYFPCLLPQPLAAYQSASEAAQNKFKNIILSYLNVKKVNNEESYTQFLSTIRKGLNDNITIPQPLGLDYLFIFACNGMITQLTANYSQTHLQHCDKQNKQVVLPLPARLNHDNDNIHSKIKSIDEFWTKLNKNDFTAYYNLMGCELKQHSPDKVTLILKEDKSENDIAKIVTLTKKNKQLEANAKNPNNKALQVMADTLSQALGPRGRVVIEVTAINMNNPKVTEIKDQLWLEAMKLGLVVEGYQPADEAIRNQGLAEQQAKLASIQDECHEQHLALR